MNTTAAQLLAEIELVEPSENTILCRINPAGLSADCLQSLRMAGEPADRVGDDFRSWLRERVLRESGRRMANDDGAAVAPLEVEAWLLPWHSWTDDELSAALAASYSWLTCDMGDETHDAFDAIHRAVVTACCTRLGELHYAIELAQSRKGN